MNEEMTPDRITQEPGENPPEAIVQAAEKAAEKSPEKLPDMEEIKSALEEILKGTPYKELRVGSDEQGVALYEIEVPLENGERAEYNYQRARYDPSDTSSHYLLRSTGSIHVVYYDSSGFPIGGDGVAEYRNGRWEFIAQEDAVVENNLGKMRKEMMELLQMESIGGSAGEYNFNGKQYTCAAANGLWNKTTGEITVFGNTGDDIVTDARRADAKGELRKFTFRLAIDFKNNAYRIVGLGCEDSKPPEEGNDKRYIIERSVNDFNASEVKFGSSEA